jgi:hypothetical protein
VNPELELAPLFDTGQGFHRLGDSPVSDLDVGFGYEGGAVFSRVGDPL